MAKLKMVGAKPHDEELRLWLETHIKQNPHLTTVVLARKDRIGMSRTALDSYLKGTYFAGDEGNGVKNSKLEPMTRAYRERVEGTERHGFAGTFVNTFSWKQLLAAWSSAISRNIIVAVYGKPGVGKSRCLMELSVRKMTTMPISILCSSNINVRYFCQRLAQEVGVSERHSIPRLEDMIADKLKRNPRPIVIDQANYLKEKSLGTICHLWEIAKVPIVLVGTTELFNLLHKLTWEDERAQLASRVAMHYPLAELGLDECTAILKRVMGDDATNETMAQIYNAAGRNFRQLEFIIPHIHESKKRNAEKLKSGAVKMEQIIESAGRRLMVA